MHDPLPSWRDTPTRPAILDFVEAITAGPGALAPAERIAVFDNDGTLWTEKPMPTQLHFIVEQWAAAARADPGLAPEQPYRAALSGDLSWLAGAIDAHEAGDDTALRVMIAALLRTTAAMGVEDYRRTVEDFFRDARHPVLRRPYAGVVYQPMVELLGFLDARGITCYIVSGGDRDFMRPMTEHNYGIPPERVIGSAVGLTYDGARNDVRYGTTFGFLDDGPEKPVRIWSRIGRRPVLAVGNSDGDIPMLRYVQAHPRSLSLLVHHDDSGRGDESYDTGAQAALGQAARAGFTIVSVRDDWNAVFPVGD